MLEKNKQKTGFCYPIQNPEIAAERAVKWKSYSIMKKSSQSTMTLFMKLCVQRTRRNFVAF